MSGGPLVGRLVLLLAVSAAVDAQSLPFRDTALPLDERVADLVGRLTLEEKAQLLDHAGPTLERFGIRSDRWNQCLNGVQWDRPTTLFPSCIAMAATWDPEHVRRDVARVLADEARAIYNAWHLDPAFEGQRKGLIYRDPVINIGRNPYWGRNHEAFGEDPFLTGRMAVAYVRGLQGDDPRHLKLAATLKHFAVNNVETGRFALDTEVPERALRDYWLPHFRAAVVEAGACSLMASYNAINGTPNNVNHWLLTEVLKGEWGHEGFVVSDLGGVRTMVEGHEANRMGYVDAVARSLEAGCDFSDREFREFIPAAVRSGKLSEQRLDDALRRVLRVRFRLGEFDPFEAGRYSGISPEVIGCEAHRRVALETSRRSIVLLQNRGGVLPLDASSLRRVAVLGPLADRVVLNNYNGTHAGLVTALQGLRERLGDEVEVVHAVGARLLDPDPERLSRIDREAGFSGGASRKFDAEGVGDFIEFRVDVPEGGVRRVTLRSKSFPSRGRYRLEIDGESSGADFDLHGAERYGVEFELGSAFLGVGKHRFRFLVVGREPSSAGYTGHFDRLQLGDDLTVELENAPFSVGRTPSSGDGLEEAVALARDADVAVVCVGTDDRVEQEGRDRRTLGLTGTQRELALAVAAANPQTIVVEMSAGPLTLTELKESAPAILQAWWGGEEGGHALAEVLLGDVNPAARLPHTVYASEAQVPPLDEYDVAAGFTYMHLRGEPLFAFGHGLSYTSFGYAGVDVAPNRSTGDGIRVRLEVTNTGERSGDEVVQIYLRAAGDLPAEPKLRLCAFRRIHLPAGASAKLEFPIAAERLARWDEQAERFVVRPGRYEVVVGASSVDLRGSATFEIDPPR